MLDLIPDGSWDHFCTQIKSKIKIDPTIEVRVGLSLKSSVLETCLGLSLFYSHKKSLAQFSGGTFAFEAAIPVLMKEGFQAQKLSIVENPENKKKFLEELKKETLMCLAPLNHPVTGESFSNGDDANILESRKIFSVKVDHQVSGTSIQGIGDYEIRILSLSSEFSLILLGEKVKFPPLFIHQIYWSTERKKEFLEKLENRLNLEQEKSDNDLEDLGKIISDFETFAEQNGFQKFFSDSKARAQDRALIYNSKIHGDLLVEKLYLALGKQRPLAGESALIQTTNLCYWGGVKMYDQWWEKVPSEEVLSSLISISADALKNPKFRAAFLTVIG